MFRIFETKNYKESIKKMDVFIYEKLQEKIATHIYPQLRQEPRFEANIKNLKNYNPETWRYRIGKYRLFYELNIPEKIVLITCFEISGKAY